MITKVGIDTLAVYSSRYALKLSTLAQKREVASDKYQESLGQVVMAVPPPGEDIVTMGANAALRALETIDKNEIELLLFATESGIDQSKAAGLYLHGLLELPSRCRVVELKQACYSGTAAIQLALPYLRENPDKKVLVVASDIARYGLNTNGESSQGAAAVAVVLAANPRLVAFDPEFGVATENVMDFWRPNYRQEALVDGKYSSKLFMTMLDKCWQQYQERSGRGFLEHDFYCYHIPVPRLVEKAHSYLAKLNGHANLPADIFNKHVSLSLEYSRQLGNSYTASLYVGLASLLDLAKEDLSNKRIGFYSYGSGCVAEYFSGVVQSGYQQHLNTSYHTELLRDRTFLSYDDYEKYFNFSYNQQGAEQLIPTFETGDFALTQLKDHKRFYERVYPCALTKSA